MSVIDSIIEKNNITGDLAKIAKGEEVELPEGFEDIQKYQEKLINDWDSERQSFYTEKFGNVGFEEKLKEHEKTWYPGVVNPIKNLIIKKAGLDKDKYKEAPVKDVINDFLTTYDSKIEALKSGSSEDVKTYVDKIENLNSEVISYKDKLQEQREAFEAKEKEIRLESQQTSLNDIKVRQTLTFVSGVKDKLSVGSVQAATDNIEGALRRNGYKLDLVKNDDGTHNLIPLHNDGSKAMNLARNKHVGLEELVLELAAKEGFMKKSNTGEGGKVIDPNAPVLKNKKTGKEFKIEMPTW